MGMFKLKKGYDIPLKGLAERRFEKAQKTTAIAVQPTDFRGLRPAMKVEPGDTVKRGTVLFVNKQVPEVVFRSPAAGTVREIVRGERRVIQRVIIDTSVDSSEAFESLSKAQIDSLTANQAKKILLNSGLWPALRQRPFSKIADPGKSPKAIFISAVDSAPLQGETDMLLEGRQNDFQSGINFLSRLSEGKIHLSVSGNTESFFSKVDGVEMHQFSGPHPAGNIGSFLNKGEYPGSKTYALTGSELKNTYYATGTEGALVTDLVSDPIEADKSRVISGNVLTGKQSSANGFVGFYDDMLTVIPELSGRRFLGWLQLGLNANSFWRLFLSKLIPGKKLAPTTDMNGEERAFVSTGEYEKLVPMDILPVHLCKAILVEDIELMEQLGIYEVAPEDLALCSYICPSKIEFGDIIEQGVIAMEKEG